MEGLLRVWTRRELVERAQDDPQERATLRIAASPRLVLALMDYVTDRGNERVELISAYGDPDACEVKFYRRDTPLSSFTPDAFDE